MSASRKLIALPVAAALSMAMAGCAQTTTMPKPANQSSATTGTSASKITGTAAVVGDSSISEQEVADYIAQYRTLTNKTSDGDWATFLDESTTTASEIRDAAIQHFAENIAVEKRAAELGIEVDDAEVDEAVSEAKELSGASGDATSWKSLLETSGYDEETYRNDMRLNVLKTKLVAQEGGLREATEPEMLTLAMNSPSSYTGKKLTDLAYPASNSYAASAFLAANQDKAYEEFLAAAREEVDQGTAKGISSDRWSCLEELPATATQVLSELKVGEAGRYVGDDGCVHIVFVTEEYMTRPNGSFLLNEMPGEIKAQLRSDASIRVRAAATTDYLAKLVSDIGLDKKEMPKGLPYDVSIDESEYGEQKTKAEQDEEAQQLVENQLDELANTSSTETEEAYNNLQNIIASSQSKKDAADGDE